MQYVVSYEFVDSHGGERKDTFYSMTYLMSFVETLLRDGTHPIKYIRISVKA